MRVARTGYSKVMYLELYGLREPPFSITPDPRFVFLSERHRDALAHLLYGVGQGGSGGFVQLTGEVGTGKTTLSRLVLEQLPENTKVALVLNPRLSPVELLESICEELRLDIGAARGSLKALVDTLNHFLLDAYAQGQRVVLILDEAQILSPDALEQIRLLTNLETPTQKLLQIILIGQPELRDKLADPALRQLAQRITARYHLMPLDEDETETYLRHRLAVAGGQRFPYSRLAVRALHRRAGGVPRLINIIAERALLAGYVADETQIGERLVEHAADEVLGRGRRARARLGAAAALLIAASGVSWWTLRDANEPVAAPPPAPVATLRPAAAPPAADTAALAAALAALPADADLIAWTHLLALWQVDPSRVTVPDAARCPPRVYAGVACLRGAGSVAKLRALGRPVLLQLRDGERNAGALLLGLDDERALLDLGPRTITVTLVALGDVWLGQYFAIWKSPEFMADPVRRGERGPAADWLRQQLAGAGARAAIDEGPAMVDGAMEAQVREVQLEFGLVADGIVGPETQFALAARERGGPRLVRALD